MIKIKIKDLTQHNDFTLVSIYKATSCQVTKTNIIEIFYKKYIPLIMHVASKYSLRLAWDRAVDYDDIINTYAEWIYKTIDYIDVAKIKNTEKFTFGSMYVRILTGYSGAWYKRQGSAEMCLPLNPSIPDPFKGYKHPDRDAERQYMVLKVISDFKDNKGPNKHNNSMYTQIMDLLEKGYSTEAIRKELNLKNCANVSYYKKRIMERLTRELSGMEDRL